MLALSKRFIVLDALAAPDTPHHCLFLSLAIGWDQNRNWLADDFLGKVVKMRPAPPFQLVMMPRFFLTIARVSEVDAMFPGGSTSNGQATKAMPGVF
jgi:hypothetical protein